VDISHVVWTERDRVGLYFLEEGKAPRGSRVIYDRANSAMSQMQPEELPSELFQNEGARLLHLTGITPALSPTAAATCKRALQLAKEAGWLISFDLNFRSLLWTPDEAREGCDWFAQMADVFFVPLGDARVVYNFGTKVPAETILLSLSERYEQATLVMTMGAEGAIAIQPGGNITAQSAFPAEEVGRLGGGDSFSAGFLYAWLTFDNPENRLETALRWGAAMAALKYSITGDIPFVDRYEVERLVNQGAAGHKLVR
jgi:2-dehydro-3-deoxygluconokinase